MDGVLLLQQQQQQQRSPHRRWIVTFLFVTLLNAFLTIDSHVQSYRTALRDCREFWKNQTEAQQVAIWQQQLEQQQLEQAQHEPTSFNNRNHALPVCTFAHLQNAFGTTTQAGNNPNNNSLSLNSSCWSLHDRILRIPLERVVNRNDNMTRLGKGKSGGVYKAILDLQQHDDRDSPRYCVAALKTDHCFEATTHVTDKTKAQSCVTDSRDNQDNSTHLLQPYVTFLDHEYTGALAWYAQLQMNQSLPGILPSWALVVTSDEKKEEDESLVSDNNDATMNGAAPSNDNATLSASSTFPSRFVTPASNIRGIVMPFMDISVTVQELLGEEEEPPAFFTPNQKKGSILAWCWRQLFVRHSQKQKETTKKSHLLPGIQVPMSPSQLAHIMLPAVQGLAFLNQLGLAHQDVHEKNLGLVKTRKARSDAGQVAQKEEPLEYHAMLFDNSFVGLVEPDSKELQHVQQPQQHLIGDTSVWNICRDPDNVSDTTTTTIGDQPRLTSPQRREAWREGLGPLGSDVTRLRHIMLRLLDRNDNDGIAHAAEMALRACETAQEMASVLERFLLQQQ